MLCKDVHTVIEKGSAGVAGGADQSLKITAHNVYDTNADKVTRSTQQISSSKRVVRGINSSANMF